MRVGAVVVRGGLRAGAVTMRSGVLGCGCGVERGGLGDKGGGVEMLDIGMQVAQVGVVVVEEEEEAGCDEAGGEGDGEECDRKRHFLRL